MNARSFFYPIGMSGLAAVISVSALTTGCKQAVSREGAATADADAVSLGVQDVGDAVARSVISGIHIMGSINPSVRVDVKAQVGGLINTVLVDRGMVVTQGQVLAAFDDHALKAQLQSVKAQLAAAERDYAATEILFKAGAASERAYVNSKVGTDSAKAQLAQVQESVNNATVRSPIAGVVSERLVSAGESAGPGQKLFAVVNSSTLELSSSILPVDFAYVKTGQKAILAFDSFGSRKIEGTVTRIDPVADPRSRQVGVYIEIPNKSGELVAGIFGSGTLVTNSGSTDKLMLIPSGAVRSEDNASVVYAIADGKLARRTVSTNPKSPEEGFVRIDSGLRDGEKIVLNPSKQLTNGAAVRIISSATP